MNGAYNVMRKAFEWFFFNEGLSLEYDFMLLHMAPPIQTQVFNWERFLINSLIFLFSQHFTRCKNHDNNILRHLQTRDLGALCA